MSKELKNFIFSFEESKGRTPKVEEIASKFQIEEKLVVKALSLLESQGKIKLSYFRRVDPRIITNRKDKKVYLTLIQAERSKIIRKFLDENKKLPTAEFLNTSDSTFSQLITKLEDCGVLERTSPGSRKISIQDRKYIFNKKLDIIGCGMLKNTKEDSYGGKETPPSTNLSVKKVADEPFVKDRDHMDYLLKKHDDAIKINREVFSNTKIKFDEISKNLQDKDVKLEERMKTLEHDNNMLKIILLVVIAVLIFNALLFYYFLINAI